jgi:hypothetical protein
MRLAFTTAAIAVALLLISSDAQTRVAASGTVLSVDTDASGNGATMVGTIQSCREVSGGTQADVDIVIQDVPSLAGFQASLFFDPGHVTVVAESSMFILNQPLLPPPFILDLSDPVPDTDGEYKILVSTSGGGTGSGVVIRLTLAFTGSGTSPLDLAAVKMKDYDNLYVQPVDANGFFTGPINDAGVAVNSGCSSDRDGDGVPDSSDNCLDWPNSDQAMPPWPVPEDDPDCDGFENSRESVLPTDPRVACGYSSGGNPSSDNWPPDLAETNSINVSDILMLKPVFGGSVPPTSARLDLVTSGTINTSDVLAIKPYFGRGCSP